MFDYICASESKKGKLGAAVNFFTNIYTESDNFFCNSTCPCNSDLNTFKSSNDSYYSTLVFDKTSDVVNVQWCESSLENIYDSLKVEDLFGDNTEKITDAEKEEYYDTWGDNAATVSEKRSIMKMQ